MLQKNGWKRYFMWIIRGRIDVLSLSNDSFVIKIFNLVVLQEKFYSFSFWSHKIVNHTIVYITRLLSKGTISDMNCFPRNENVMYEFWNVYFKDTKVMVYNKLSCHLVTYRVVAKLTNSSKLFRSAGSWQRLIS